MLQKILIAVCTLAVVACAPPKMYNWGDYEQGLYKTYKDPTEAAALRTSLQDHVMQAEASKQKVAPGLYAELGTLYLESGDPEKAKFYYAKERDAWPESATLMTALINNVNRPSNTKEKGKGTK